MNESGWVIPARCSPVLVGFPVRNLSSPCWVIISNLVALSQTVGHERTQRICEGNFCRCGVGAIGQIWLITGKVVDELLWSLFAWWDICLTSSKAFYSAADRDHCPEFRIPEFLTVVTSASEIRVMRHDVPWRVFAVSDVLGFWRIKFYTLSWII